MDIVIAETYEQKNLSFYCSKTGNDKLRDFLSNAGLFNEEYLRFDETEEAFICSKATFDEWEPIIKAQQQLDKRLAELKIEHGEFYIDEIIAGALFNDWRDEAAAIELELDKVLLEA